MFLIYLIIYDIAYCIAYCIATYCPDSVFRLCVTAKSFGNTLDQAPGVVLKQKPCRFYSQVIWKPTRPNNRGFVFVRFGT